MARTGASFNRAGSKQNHETPAEFIRAVEARFGRITFDLAADKHNAKAAGFFSEQDDALHKIIWPRAGLNWLNPPFFDIRPWARRCDHERHNCTVAFLVPASVGSEWCADHAWNKALILFVRPRLTFVGEPTCYPKDLMLAIYGHAPAIELWHWKRDIRTRWAAAKPEPADPEADDMEADRIASTLEAEVDLSDRCRRE